MVAIFYDNENGMLLANGWKKNRQVAKNLPAAVLVCDTKEHLIGTIMQEDRKKNRIRKLYQYGLWIVHREKWIVKSEKLVQLEMDGCAQRISYIKQ